MKWITTTDIVQWAPKRDCQSTLPQLVRKLIRATSGSINKIYFPSGDNITIGGWDGILEIAEGTEFIPEGVSVWEFGTSKDCKGKADEDYEKRTANPIGINPTETTFVFVTPRNWTKGDEWIEEKKKDGKWKDVQVINAAVLEEWLEVAPTVAEWLAAVHLGKPSLEVQSTDSFWDRWSTGPNIKIIPGLLLGGRENSANSLKMCLKEPSLLAIKSSSREESVAFIVSVFKHSAELEEDFFARSLIIEQPNTFRQLIAQEAPLILIPLFEDEGSFQYAINKGHNVIVPLGADSTDRNNQITLQPLDRDQFVKDLTNSGVAHDKATKLAKESARNITVLRRQLEFINNLPEWAKAENVREIIPALLVGRWSEEFAGDKAVIEELAGENYVDYSKKLIKWINKPDSPIIQIGNTWRLTSPLDAWTNASRHLTNNDFDLLGANFLKVLGEINPVFELQPEQRMMAQFHGKHRMYSDWIRDGLSQSMILVSIYGSQLTQVMSGNSSAWCDEIVRRLLDNPDPLLWKSIGNKLPLLAEASPDQFMRLTEKYLGVDPSPVAALFEENPGFMIPETYYTGMLYALEGLAWFPEYLSRSTLLLAQLAAIDPGGTLSNRPDKSLYEIFLPWHYQTNATFDERMEVLSLIASKQPVVAWKLFKAMLPIHGGGVAFNTHKLRWRAFNENFEKKYLLREMWDTHSKITGFMLSIFDFTEDKFSELVNISSHLSPADRDTILNFIEEVRDKVNHSTNKTWHVLRQILSDHRSHPGEEGTLPDTVLSRYSELYDLLEPLDELEKIAWIFEDHWPTFPEGTKIEDYESRQEFVTNRRSEILSAIYERDGIKKILDFADILKDTWILGDVFGTFISDEELFNLLKRELMLPENSRFIQSLLIRKSLNSNIDYIIALHNRLKEAGLNEVALSRLLIPTIQSSAFWAFIDTTEAGTQVEYWKNMHPHFWNLDPTEKEDGLRRLINAKRFFSAMEVLHSDLSIYSSDLLTDLLTSAANVEASEKGNFRDYHVRRIIEELSTRDDVQHRTIMQLEWFYLEILLASGFSKGAENLSEGLASDPEFFIDMLKCAYKPDNEELLKKEVEGLDETLIASRGRLAWKLLHNWTKVPGIDSKGIIDSDFFNRWIDQVRTLAKECDRLEPADIVIGSVLAHCPQTEENWPPIPICEAFERINTDAIRRNYSTALFNKNGFSTRGTFDGGDVEREKMNRFRSLADNYRNRFPVIANIFSQLAKGYEQDAMIMDQKAERDKLDF